MVIGHTQRCSCTPGQFSLLRGLAVLVCLVWGKAEPATRPSRTILHSALNGQTATSNLNSRQLCLTHVPHVDTVGHALHNIHGWRGGGGGGGWVTKLYAHALCQRLQRSIFTYV